MKKEFIIWGCTKENPNEEQLLVSEMFDIKSIEEAERIKTVLETKHGCANVRIQVIDFSNGFNGDFIKAIKI